MTKNKALYNWFNSLYEDIPFYRDTNVPLETEYPYGTYTYVEEPFPSTAVGITVNLWFRTESEAIPDEAVSDLSKAIGYSGAVISCDEGHIWINKGTPFCQSLTYEDTAIKRRYINLLAEYLTFY